MSGMSGFIYDVHPYPNSEEKKELELAFEALREQVCLIEENLLTSVEHSVMDHFQRRCEEMTYVLQRLKQISD